LLDKVPRPSHNEGEIASEEEFGALVVMDTFGYANPAVELDPSDPIDFQAKKPLK
jgi:hypothetical protein